MQPSAPFFTGADECVHGIICRAVTCEALLAAALLTAYAAFTGHSSELAPFVFPIFHKLLKETLIHLVGHFSECP